MRSSSFRQPQRFDRWLPQLLIALLALPPGAGAQQPPAQSKPEAPAPTVQSLRVIALAGNGEFNDLASHVMAPLVVQVLDRNARPVEGADVTFRFPLTGPGARYANQATSQTVRTDLDGQAAATGWTASGGPGTFRVQVTASRGNEQGQTMVTMTNVATLANAPREQTKHWWSSKWGKIGLIAGGAAAVAAIVIVKTRGSGTTTITGVPGFPTIGGPQ
jgi:hypothetical protein